MKTVSASSILALALMAGCAADLDQTSDFATALPYAEGSQEAKAIVHVANDTRLTVEHLGENEVDGELGVGLDRRAAKNIVAYRDGNPFDGEDTDAAGPLGELYTVSYCKKTCLAKLLDYAKATGVYDQYASGGEGPAHFAPGQLSAGDNAALFGEYCLGELTQRPVPNYDNELVGRAAAKLSLLHTDSFSLYSDIKKHHKTAIPEGVDVSQDAHDFLGYLCGEFRDRATMIEAKLNWVADMNYLPMEEQAAYDPSGNPWRQITAHDYGPYLHVSSDLWHARRDQLSDEGNRYTMVGNKQVDTPVPGNTLCDTKYIFAEYVKKGRQFDDMAAYDAGYQAFRTQHCDLSDNGDEDWIHHFRGDSNIKPNSPESNGMIWFSRTMTRQCTASESRPYQTARGGDWENDRVDDAACQRYFQYPFASRYNAARAAMASWTLYDPNASGLGSSSDFMVFPKSVDDPTYIFGDRAPYAASNYDGPLVYLSGYDFSQPDFGLGAIHNNDAETLNKLLQLAVDRHTDWYSSGYDDEMPKFSYGNTEAYSMLVAGSYEMEESDSFVSPCYTVPCNGSWADYARNYKHLMYVFKIHKDNWYTPESINAGTPIDFDKQWYDETAFGDSSLANSEKAMDRVGTALEPELDSILYLQNICSSGAVLGAGNCN
jgi:hypothetical protein